MSDRFTLNRTPQSPAARAAYRLAKKRLEEGAYCDDCKEVHSMRKAVMFILQKAPTGDFSAGDYFVSMLCEFHADLFAARTGRQTLIEARSGSSTVVEDDKTPAIARPIEIDPDDPANKKPKIIPTEFEP
jgi:hypothetical protein